LTLDKLPSTYLPAQLCSTIRFSALLLPHAGRAMVSALISLPQWRQCVSTMLIFAAVTAVPKRHQGRARSGASGPSAPDAYASGNHSPGAASCAQSARSSTRAVKMTAETSVRWQRPAPCSGRSPPPGRCRSRTRRPRPRTVRSRPGDSAAGTRVPPWRSGSIPGQCP
jgi:hypothetical protein